MLYIYIYIRRATSGGVGVEVGRGQGGCPYLEEKGPNCVYPWIQSSIQHVILRVSRRKSSKIFPSEAFFLVFLTKRLSRCPNSTKPPLP